MLLKGDFYEKWQIDIVLIRKYCEVYNSFKEQTLQGKVYVWDSHFWYCLSHIILTWNLLYMLVKIKQNTWNIFLKGIFLRMGSQGPNIFEDQFYSKNARELRFHVLLRFHARKHISQFKLKKAKFSRRCEFCFNLVQASEYP